MFGVGGGAGGAGGEMEGGVGEGGFSEGGVNGVSGVGFMSGAYGDSLASSSRSAALLLSELGRPASSVSVGSGGEGSGGVLVRMGGVSEGEEGFQQEGGSGVDAAAAASAASAGALLAAHAHARARHQTYLASAASGRSLLASSLSTFKQPLVPDEQTFLDMPPMPTPPTHATHTTHQSRAKVQRPSLDLDVNLNAPLDIDTTASNVEALRQKLHEEEQQLKHMISLRRKRRLELEQQELIDNKKAKTAASASASSSSSTSSTPAPAPAPVTKPSNPTPTLPPKDTAKLSTDFSSPNAKPVDTITPIKPLELPPMPISRDEITNRIKKYLLRVYLDVKTAPQEHHEKNKNTSNNCENTKDKQETAEKSCQADDNKNEEKTCQTDDNKNEEKTCQTDDDKNEEKTCQTDDDKNEEKTSETDDNKQNDKEINDNKHNDKKENDKPSQTQTITNKHHKTKKTSLPPIPDSKKDQIAAALAKLIESRIYKVSPSFYVYSDPTTLPHRIQHHAISLGYRFHRHQTHKQRTLLSKTRQTHLQKTLGRSFHNEIQDMYKELHAIRKTGSSWKKGRIKIHEEIPARDAVPPAIASLYFPKDGGLISAVKRVQDARNAPSLQTNERIENVDWKGLLKKAKSTLTSYRRMEMRQLKLEVEEVQRKLHSSQPGLAMAFSP